MRLLVKLPCFIPRRTLPGPSTSPQAPGGGGSQVAVVSSHAWGAGTAAAAGHGAAPGQRAGGHLCVEAGRGGGRGGRGGGTGDAPGCGHGRWAGGRGWGSSAVQAAGWSGPLDASTGWSTFPALTHLIARHCACALPQTASSTASDSRFLWVRQPATAAAVGSAACGHRWKGSGA